MRRLQTAELFVNEKQEKADGKARDQEVLSVLPEAHASQGSQIETDHGRRTGE
jgi:hypothetical protein